MCRIVVLLLDFFYLCAAGRPKGDLLPIYIVFGSRALVTMTLEAEENIDLVFFDYIDYYLWYR
jgi:hypothetical protein